MPIAFNPADLWATAPMILVSITALIVLVIDSISNDSPLIPGVTLVGLVGAMVVAAMQLVPGALPATSAYFGMVAVGGFASFFNLIFLLSAFLTVLLSRDYLTRKAIHFGEYYALVLFATVGMMVLGTALDLITVFVGLEFMSLCLYALSGMVRDDVRSNESALKYFLLGAFAAGFFLYGIAILYGTSGTTSLIGIGHQLGALYLRTGFWLGTGLLLIGFFFKISAVPFHMWTPDVYEGAPTSVSAFMSTGSKAAAFASLIVVCTNALGQTDARWQGAMGWIAVFTMIVGNIIAVTQPNLKRMLAYSSVAHAGYMLVGLASGRPDGYAGVLFYALTYTAMNMGAFGVLGVLEGDRDSNTIEHYAGLSTRRPGLAALMAIFMFSLTGLPPFAGFIGKYLVFRAAIEGGYTWLAVVGAVMSVVSAYYYLRVVWVMYFNESTEAQSAEARLAPNIGGMSLAALALSAVLCVALTGVFKPIISLAIQVLGGLKGAGFTAGL